MNTLAAFQSSKTHCPKGHPYSPENTYRYNRGTTGQTRRVCRACSIEKDAERRQRPDVRERRRRERLTPRRLATHRAWTLRTWYGITEDGYQARLAEQGGRCAICRCLPNPTKRLAVDHDHELNMVRGLLCDDCNRGLGIFKDDPEIVERAAQYLRKYWPEEAFA